MRQPAHQRGRSYAPRGMRVEAAADWVGFGTTKFLEMVADGRMPAGKPEDGCRLSDHFRLDEAFDASGFTDHAPAEESPIAIDNSASSASALCAAVLPLNGHYPTWFSGDEIVSELNGLIWGVQSRVPKTRWYGLIECTDGRREFASARQLAPATPADAAVRL